jgi:hypothetical protein
MHPMTDSGQAPTTRRGTDVWSKVAHVLGGVLVVPGLGWYVVTLPIAVNRITDDPEVITVLSSLSASAVGLVPAVVGYALMRVRRPRWPAATSLGVAALGLGWLLCMGTAAVASGRLVGGLLVASLGLVPVALAAGAAWLRARRPTGTGLSPRPQRRRQSLIGTMLVVATQMPLYQFVLLNDMSLLPRLLSGLLFLAGAASALWLSAGRGRPAEGPGGAGQPGSRRRWMTPPVAYGLLYAAMLTPAVWSVAELTPWGKPDPRDVAQAQVFDPPRQDPELLTVHGDGRWTAEGLKSAVPVGDMVIAELQGDTSYDTAGVVALRAHEGAELWRWEPDEDDYTNIHGVAVDPVDGVVLAVVWSAHFDWALVGRDLDGNVTFTRELPSGGRDDAQWSPVWPTRGPDGQIDPRAVLGRVAVLEVSDSPSQGNREVVGVQVATGEELWRRQVPAGCDIWTTTLPQSSPQGASVPSASVILGTGPCAAASLSRYDDAHLRWETAVPDPGDAEPLGMWWVQANLAAPHPDSILLVAEWLSSSGDHWLITFDGNGRHLATVPEDDRELYGLRWGEPPLPVQDEDGEPLVAIPSTDHWRLYDPRLSERDTVRFGEPDAERPQTAIGPAWPLVPEYVPGAGEVALRDPAQRLQVVETIPLSPEERCGTDRPATLAGDADHLIVVCDDYDVSTVSVIPLPAR